MATPDGISTDDWDVVHELAVAIVNAADSKENTRWAATESWVASLTAPRLTTERHGLRRRLDALLRGPQAADHPKCVAKRILE
jgi:hypothetical protein